MFCRFLFSVLLSFSICTLLLADQLKAPSTTKKPNVNGGINSKFKNLYKTKRQLELSQNLTGQLNRIRNSQNESFSKILQQVYRTKRGQMPSKAKIQQLDKFLRQAVKFRTTDNKISSRTLRELIRANKAFDGLDRKPLGIQKLSNEIKTWDNARLETTKIYNKVNGIRVKLGYKPLEPYKVKVVRRIATNDYGFLLEDSIRHKQELTQKLIDSGRYKSKAEIRQAILRNDPAVREIAQLDRRIRFLDKSIKTKPLKKASHQVSKIHQQITNSAKGTTVAQRGIAFLNKMPANGSILEALKSQRTELYRSLKTSGKYNNWKEVRAALNNPKVNDSQIIELRQLDQRIQKARFDIKMTKLPPVTESKIFSSRWSAINKELTRLKTLRSYAKGNDQVKADHIKSLKLAQKSLFMEQASIRLKHSLIADGTFKSTKGIDVALQSKSISDPRLKSLARLQTDMSVVKAQITRSTSGKIGYITRLYNEAKANEQLTKPNNPAQKVKKVASSASNSLQNKLENTSKTLSTKAQQIVQKTQELYVRGKDGFSKASSKSLDTGKQLFVRSGQTFEQAKSILVEKSGKLYRSSKSGLIRIKDATTMQGRGLYKAASNGTVSALKTVRNQSANLYIKAQDGLVRATHKTLTAGAKVYTAGSNGVKQASGTLISKGNNLYVATKDGLMQAKSSTVKGATKYYDLAKDGSTKVVRTISNSGGHLWQETSKGLSKVTRGTLAEGTKLYVSSKKGLVEAKNLVIEKSGKLYTTSKQGLVSMKNGAITKGANLYRSSRDGIYRTGKAVSTQTSELYVKTQKGFQRAARSTLNQGTKIYTLGREGLVGAKNIVIEKAGKLYSAGQNGLTRLKGTTTQGMQIYQTARNGVVTKVQATSQQMNGLYSMGKGGLVRATQATINKGSELYSITKNGVQNVTRSSLQKMGNLYTNTSRGIAKATGNTIQTGSKLYQFGKNGLTQVQSGLVESGGKLYNSTKDGLIRATKAGTNGATKLYTASKDGAVKLAKASGDSINRLYTSGKDGLVRVSQNSLRTGSKIYTLGKNGALKTSKAFISTGNQMFQSTKNGLVEVSKSAVAKGSQVLKVTKNGVQRYAAKTTEYVNGRIRMGQLNAGHQWLANKSTGGTGFLGNNYQPAAPANSNVKAAPAASSNSRLNFAKIQPLNNSSTPSPIGGNPGQNSAKHKAWDKVRDSAWGKQTMRTGKELAKGIGDLKGKSPTEVVKHVKNVGNQVVDKTLAPNGYEAKRDAIASKLQTKITQLTQDIATAKANNQIGKAQKLQALRSSLESEYQKSQIGPQGAKLQSEIKTINDQISNLKNSGGKKADIKALQAIKSQKEASLKEIQGNKATSAKSYVRDGLRFAVISAATQGILNIVDQVKKGENVNVGNAFNFVTSPQFVLGTSGAFAGGLIVQKGLASGLGKIMMHSVMNVIPGGPFVKSVVNVLPYTLGAMVGSDLLTGNLGQRGMDEVLVSGIGSSVGMMLGSAIFPPIGSIAGAVLGGMIADAIMKSGNSSDSDELAVRMLYEPRWLEFNELAYSDQDTAELQATMDSDTDDFHAWMKPFLDGLTTVEELEKAKADSYQRYTNAVNDEGPDSPNAKNAYRLYQEIGRRMDEARSN